MIFLFNVINKNGKFHFIFPNHTAKQRKPWSLMKIKREKAALTVETGNSSKLVGRFNVGSGVTGISSIIFE